MDQVVTNTKKLPGVEDVFAVSGFDICLGGLKTSAGVSFIILKDWKERTTPHSTPATCRSDHRCQ
jgi:multidrug efflux pump